MVNKPSEGTLPEQNNGVDLIKQDAQDVICRVFSRRHGISKIEEQYWTEAKQAPNVLLSVNGKKEMEDLADEFIGFGCKPEDTVIVYSPQDEEWNKIRRIIQSKNILQSRLQCTAIPTNLLNTWVKIEDSKWELVNQSDRIVGKMQHTYESVKLTRHEILKSFNSLEWVYSKYKNIILLSHKSNETGIDITSTPETNTITISWNKDDWSHDLDIVRNNEGKAKYKNHKAEKDILQITSKNIDKILISFKDETELLDRITVCKKENRAIFEIQNIVNTYFKKYPELYERYLNTWNLDLTLFCLANLIENLEIDIVRKNTKDLVQSHKNQLKSIFDLIMANIPDIKIYEFFIKELFSLRKKYKLILPDNLVCYIRDKAKSNMDFLLIMNYYENIYPLVQDIRSKSLDMRIVNWEDIEPEFNFDKENWYLDLFLKDEKTNIKIIKEKQAATREKFRLIYEEMKNGKEALEDSLLLDMLSKISRKIQYIEADAGSGKSFLLSQIQEKLKSVDFKRWNKSYFPIFLSLSWIEKTVDIIAKVKQIKSNYLENNNTKKSNTILVLDSLDESWLDEYEIKLLFKYLTEFSGKVIITSRKWYIPKEKENKDEDRKKTKENIDITQLKEIENINWYVQKYFNNKEHKDKKLENFNSFRQNKWLNWIEKNPLILSMICFLIDTWENIEKISTISDLYEKIIDLRLLNRENNKDKNSRQVIVRENDDKLKKKIIDKRKQFLSELAYENVFEWMNLSKDIFDRIQQQEGKAYNLLIPDDDCLNLLFRKNNNQEYDFVHQSFKEYFAAKYLLNLHDENEIVKKIKEGMRKREPFSSDITKYNILYFMLKYFSEDKAYNKLLFNCIKKIDHSYLYDTLFRFSEEWNKSVVEFLLKTWINVDDWDWEWNALMYACRWGKKNVFDFLIKEWADIKKIVKLHRKTALMFACQWWNLKIIDFLIRNWVKINEKNSSRETCLFYAVRNWNLDVIKLLVKNDRDIINMKNKIGDCVLRWWSNEIIEFLIKEWCDVKEENKDWCFFLEYYKLSDEKIVDLVLNSWFEINKPNRYGRTLLMNLCWSDNIKYLELLIKKWADIDMKGKNEETCLMFATELFNLSFVKFIVEKKMNKINDRDVLWNTAIFYCCLDFPLYSMMDYQRDVEDEKRRKEIVKFLLKNWAKINDKNNDWMTPLIFICSKLNWRLWSNTESIIEAMDFLIKNWANKDEIDNKWKTALDYARESKNQEIINFLLGNWTI